MVKGQSKTLLEFKKPGAEKWCLLAADRDEEQQNIIRSNQEELKNALLTSLQMQHVVVLAGSGCSLSANGPSMGDLWGYCVVDKLNDAAPNLLELVGHDKSNKDIEALLSRVEAYLYVKEDKKLRDFFNDCRKIILDKCSAFLAPDRLGPHKTFLHRLSRRRVRDRRLKLFTTNYDLCFEVAASGQGGVALDGFSFAVPRHYDPQYFSYDIVRRPQNSESIGSYLEGVFLLYKLHGSVNWERGEDGIIRECNKPAPEKACLIYPAKGKYQQSYVEPHLESMGQYLAAVREPNTCLIVAGFGFNDDHLSEPLLAAAMSNPHLRVIIADPCARWHSNEGNSYWKKLAQLCSSGEDVWLIAADFAQFAHMIPDLKSLTPADALAKAVKGVTGKI